MMEIIWPVKPKILTDTLKKKFVSLCSKLLYEKRVSTMVPSE